MAQPRPFVWMGFLSALLVLGAWAFFAGVFFAVVQINPLIKIRITEAFDLSTDYHQNHYGGRSLRIKKWKCAMIVWKNNLLFGTGTGADNGELKKVYLQEDFMEAYKANYNAHNVYLQVAMGLGLFGLMFFVYLLFSIFKDGLDKQNFTLSFFVVLFSVSSFTESMLSTQKGIVFFCLFICILSYPCQKQDTKNQPEPSSSPL